MFFFPDNNFLFFHGTSLYFFPATHQHHLRVGVSNTTGTGRDGAPVVGRVVGQRVERVETEINEQSNRGNDVRTETSIVGTSVVQQCVNV